jgi:hypothetical protein
MTTTTSTVAAVARSAPHFLFVLANLITIACAQKATTGPLDTVPPALSDYGLLLSLSPFDTGPVPYNSFPVAPLTAGAGLNQSGVLAYKVGNFWMRRY